MTNWGALRAGVLLSQHPLMPQPFLILTMVPALGSCVCGVGGKGLSDKMGKLPPIPVTGMFWVLCHCAPITPPKRQPFFQAPLSCSAVWVDEPPQEAFLARPQGSQLPVPFS